MRRNRGILSSLTIIGSPFLLVSNISMTFGSFIFCHICFSFSWLVIFVSPFHGLRKSFSWLVISLILKLFYISTCFAFFFGCVSGLSFGEMGFLWLHKTLMLCVVVCVYVYLVCVRGVFTFFGLVCYEFCSFVLLVVSGLLTQEAIIPRCVVRRIPQDSTLTIYGLIVRFST